MSKMNQVQQAVRALDGGAYQKLMDMYLYKRFAFSNITPLGSHTGTNKTTKGTPDSYVLTDDDKFILIAYGSVSEESYSKIEQDILRCLDQSKTGVNVDQIVRIICCHTSTNITPGQSKQLCSHFPDTLLIGLGELTLDLCLKYPVIAKDHLSIEIDTHQIFDLKDYIDYVSHNVYSTPLDMPILCREKEINDLLAVLDRESIIVICGKSGIGKTRLALELAEKYSSEKHYCVKIIKANSESIYEDLKATFVDDQNFLIVVDDADQLVQLKHLINMCIEKRNHYMKIIMTVRDYAKESLLQSIKAIYNPTIFPLEVLDGKSVELVLKENLGIKNENIIHQIQTIAKGNIRLAIMAGNCAIEGKFDSIRNAFDIFDFYFSDIIAHMDRKETITAMVIAFFDSLTLRESERPIILALEQGIEFGEFVENCRSLHSKEVVSIFRDFAVKFEDQNLRDYLLYYVIFKQKWITPSYIILSVFPTYRKRVIYAFNTLIQLFNTQDNIQYLEVEVKKAWREIKTKSEDTTFDFVEAFHAFIPDETLMIAKKAIDDLPEVHMNFSLFDFEKTSNNHRIDSKIIMLLKGFKYSKYLVEAIQLACYHLERNTLHPMDFYFLFGKDLGFDYESYKFRFSQERVLVERMIEYYKEKETTEAAFCLFFCITNCLEFQFSSVRENHDNSVAFLQFGIPACNEIFEIRSVCFEALTLLFDNPMYRNLALKALIKYSGFPYYDSDQEILVQDIAAFCDKFSTRLDIDSFNNCIIVQHMQAICQRNKMGCPKVLKSYQKNRIFMMYLTIKKDRLLKCKDYELAERIRKEKIRGLIKSATNDEFELLWIALNQNDINRQNEWEVSNGIGIVFSLLIDLPDRFVTIAESYMRHGTPYGMTTYSSITSGLITILGYQGALAFINANDFLEKRKWFALICDSIPDSEINDETGRFFIEKLNEQLSEENLYLISLSTALKINSRCPGFLVDYVIVMNEICEKCPWKIAEFLSWIDIKDEVKCDEVISCFGENTQVIETAYLNAMQGRKYFDYKGLLLICIIRKDINFLRSIVNCILDSSYSHYEGTNLEILWDQDNCNDLMNIVMDVIKENERLHYWNSLGERLLSYGQNKEEHWPKKDAWIENFIKRNCDDSEDMAFIFGTICNLSGNQSKAAILQFCRYNKEFSDFKKLPLLSGNMTWSGSEVPILEQQIKFLEELKDQLAGFDYIEHRAYLDDYIHDIRIRIEGVLLEEFIEER